ncbi:hypothetical protein JW926_04845 [Candidatus Sumerlaeota bacterium]|nr:hypothetical protein [Candidatus Sumerlaeota bacterium]
MRKEKRELDNQKIQDSYLGFIIIRPLPGSVIGRTCLRTYPPDGGRRRFPVTRTYHANLFGIKLEIESLAFQEQDQTVAACATSALWSSFQKTGMLFQHAISSPVEITKAANEKFPLASRGLPSHGLTAEQMAAAIRSVGLEPYLIKTIDLNLLRSVIYAYIMGGIPPLLLFDLFKKNGEIFLFLGKHAVTVTGFSMSSSDNADDSPIFNLNIFHIDKIYVHDDQAGPFGRMILDGKKINDEKESMASAWGEEYRAVPEFVLVPLYHKIRIPFELVYQIVESYGSFLKQIQRFFPEDLSGNLEWDIHLENINEYKQDLFNSNLLKGEYLEKILCEPLPRFIWRALLLKDGVRLFDLLFDATDIEQGQFLLKAVEYEKEFGIFLRNIYMNESIKQSMKSAPAWQIMKWYLENQLQ